MEIKRTQEIFQEQFKLSKPNTSGEFTKYLVKKWVAVDDMIELVKYARNHCRGDPDIVERLLLESLSTLPKAKETNCDFKKELQLDSKKR